MLSAVTLAAVLLSFTATGPEDGAPVMLLHGFPDLHTTWANVAPDLARDHRVVVPDLRGYGASPSAPEGGSYDLDELAADVVHLADHLGWDTFHLVGHDWGAAVAWWVAMHHPERLRSLTVLQVAHPMAWEQFAAVSAEQRKARRPFRALVLPGAAGFLASIARKDPARLWRANLARPDALPDDALHELSAHFASPDAWKGPLRYYDQVYRPFPKRFASIRDVPKVTVPTLVFFGAQDAYLRPGGAALSCGWVAARCEVVVEPDAGHWPHWDVPDRVIAAWRGFVGASGAP